LFLVNGDDGEREAEIADLQTGSMVANGYTKAREKTGHEQFVRKLGMS